MAIAPVAAGCAAPGPGEGDPTADGPVEGTLEIAVIDHADGHEIRQPILRLPDGAILRLIFDTPPTVSAGTRVRISGYLDGPAQLHVQALDVVMSTAVGSDDLTGVRGAVSSATPVKRKTAVIMFNFQNDTSQPHTQDTMRSMIFTGAPSASSYLKEWSYGLVELTGKTRTDGDVFGWFTVPFNNTPTCDWEAWLNAVRPMATAAGFNQTGYDNVIFFWVGTSACNFGGIAWTPVESALNGYGSDAASHELMHNLGIGHSDSIQCTNAAGTAVPLASTSNTTCTQVGYGDELCTQGYLYTYRPHINSFHKARAGWLSPTNMVTLDQAGTRTIVAQESASNLIQSLRIPRDGDTYFHIERRQPIGYDVNLPAAATTGVLLRIVPEYAFADSTLLIDMQPGTTNVADSGLQVGQTFSEPGRGVTIRLDSVNAAGANVTITVPPADTNDGSGIQGQYFSNTALTGTPTVVRTDPAVVFNWGDAAPAAGVPVDGFSARWSGQIKPRYSETYTFTTYSDDGVRLWVNGQQIINNWTDHSQTRDTGTITLTANTRYDIVMEYYDSGGGATAKLFWASPTQPREIIPRSRLYRPASSTLPGSASVPSPVDLATSVATSPTLAWSAGSGATSRAIYFGTQSPPPQTVSSQTALTYAPGTLQPSTTYFWQVVERNATGTTPGPIWRFTTGTGAGVPVTLLTDGFESDFNLWTDGGTTNWDRATDQKHAGGFAARCGSSDTNLTSDNLNTSGKQSFTVTFWYRDSGVDDDDDVFLQFYNGTSYVNRFELGNSAENTWNQYTVTVNAASEPTFFRTNFRISLAGDSIDSGELLWIDDVVITAQ